MLHFNITYGKYIIQLNKLYVVFVLLYEGTIVEALCIYFYYIFPGGFTIQFSKE